MNYILAGVGGQGTVLASKLLAAAAIARGETAHTAETIGMAQRGGSVVSHVRLGECYSPLVPVKQADVIIGFEPSEAVRNLEFLKENGIVVVSTTAVKPVTASLMKSEYDGEEMITYLKANVRELIIVDGESLCQSCGSQKVLNVGLLGAAAKAKSFGFTFDELKATIMSNMAPKHIELNLKALELGYNNSL